MNSKSLAATFSVLTCLAFITYGQSQSGQQSTSGQSQSGQTQSGQTRQDANRTGSRTDSGKQHSGQAGQAGQANLDSSDRHFVTDAAESGMSEVAMGQMAVQRASNDQVKQFAQRMVDDHTKANQELMQLASSKGVSMPQGMMMSGDQQTSPQSNPPAGDQRTNPQSNQSSADRQMTQTGQAGGQHKGKDQAMMDRMSRLSGADFDREYMRQQVKDHDKAVDLFQKEADRGKDQELKAWASKTLPTLREHQQMARQLASTAGASDKSSSSSKKSGSGSSRNNGQPGRP